MKNATRGKIIKGCAVGLDVAVPAITAMTQFPVWVEKSSEATVSGLFLFFAVLSCIPFINQIKQFMKSPSVPVLWIVLLVAFVAIRNIIDEAIVICFFGAIANIIGAGIYKIGDVVGKREDVKKVQEEEVEDVEED